MVEIVAGVESILDYSGLENIQNTCIVCRISATIVAIHSLLLEEIQSDNKENSEH